MAALPCRAGLRGDKCRFKNESPGSLKCAHTSLRAADFHMLHGDVCGVPRPAIEAIVPLQSGLISSRQLEGLLPAYFEGKQPHIPDGLRIVHLYGSAVVQPVKFKQAGVK